MGDKFKIATLSELEEDRGTIIEKNGLCLALFKVDEKIFAIDNSCPHAEGPLGEGDFENKIVTCPWHGWQFDVTTGANEEDPELKVKTYPVEVQGADIYVTVE